MSSLSSASLESLREGISLRMSSGEPHGGEGRDSEEKMGYRTKINSCC